MTDSAILVIFVILAALTVIMLSISLLNRRRNHGRRAFLWLGFITQGWLLCEIGFFACQDTLWAIRFFNGKIAFVAFSAVALFVMTMRFYRKDQLLTRRFLTALCIIPVVTAVLAFTGEFHPLIRRDLEIISTHPLHIAHFVHGVWFWIHAAYSYLLVLASCLVVILQHRKLPFGYRRSSALLLLGILTSMITNVLTVFPIINVPFDVTPVSLCVSMLFVHVAVTDHDGADFLILARNDIFNYIEDHIFILDNRRMVLDMNISARQWMRSLGLPFSNEVFSFDKVLARLTRTGIAERPDEDEPSAAVGVYSFEGRQPVAYNLRERPLLDQSGAQAGAFATFADITRYKKLIDQLAEAADIDPLTGLANRRNYERMKKELDTPEHLPLSVVLGDVNGLKRVNDNLGHEQGDKVLCAVANQMLSCGGKDCVAARIGGDEFIMLLPRASQMDTQRAISNIRDSLAKDTTLPPGSSVALGYTTKVSTGEDLETLIRQADKAMYEDKMTDRRGRNSE